MLAHCAGDGDKKARSPRRARRNPLKPLRGECRAFSGVTVVTNSYAFYFCIRGCGRIERPAFPAPSVLGGTICWQSPGELRRGDTRSCVLPNTVVPAFAGTTTNWLFDI